MKEASVMLYVIYYAREWYQVPSSMMALMIGYVTGYHIAPVLFLSALFSTTAYSDFSRHKEATQLLIDKYEDL